MGSRKISVNAVCLLVLVLLWSQTASFADDPEKDQSILQSQKAEMDTRQNKLQNGADEQKSTEPDKPVKPVLNGVVQKEGTAEKDGTASAPQTDESGLGQTELNIRGSRTITLDAAQTQNMMKAARGFFQLFLGANGVSGSNPTIELGRRTPHLSPEEYRQMEYGIIGLDALVQVGSTAPVVTTVYPGSPAYASGIRHGDLIVKAQDHVFKPGEGQRVLWQIICGRAGTPVDITVLRDGELVKFRVIRMNIEDIEDARRRRQYEDLLSVLGTPHYTAGGDLQESAQQDVNDLNNLIRFGRGKRLQLDLDKLR